MLRMLSAAVSAGVPPSELGVISPYRSQVGCQQQPSDVCACGRVWQQVSTAWTAGGWTAFKGELGAQRAWQTHVHHAPSDSTPWDPPCCCCQVALLDRQAREARLEGVEALTVDKCQGRDKEAIVLSLVRSNAEGEAGAVQAGRQAGRLCWRGAGGACGSLWEQGLRAGWPGPRHREAAGRVPFWPAAAVPR